MSRFSEKIIEHVQFAKGWLERAEEEYSQEKILEAELTLSLAEAEVRHAWETSRGSEISVNSRMTRLWRQRLLAILVVGLAVAIGYLIATRNSGYPTPALIWEQPVFPGSWQSQVEFNLVVREEPFRTEPELSEPVVVEEPQAALVVPEVSVDWEPPLTVVPTVTAPVLPEIEEAPVTEEQEEQDLIPVAPEPIQPPEVISEPPKINMGELFKVATDALKGE